MSQYMYIDQLITKSEGGEVCLAYVGVRLTSSTSVKNKPTFEPQSSAPSHFAI